MRVFLLPLIFLPLLQGAADLYKINPAPQSHFALEIEKTGLMAGKKHHFEFSRYHGSLKYDKEQAANSSMKLAVESQSAVCQDTWVKPKDREKIQSYALHEMLDAERYPEIVFESTTVKPMSEGRFQVQGRLTIRDQTKPATAEVKVEASNGQQLRFTGQANVRLTDYNLKPPTAALGAIGTKDKMTVLFQLTGEPAK
jgi:polyisoprenoid-binding protein YceI